MEKSVATEAIYVVTFLITSLKPAQLIWIWQEVGEDIVDSLTTFLRNSRIFKCEPLAYSSILKAIDCIIRMQSEVVIFESKTFDFFQLFLKNQGLEELEQNSLMLYLSPKDVDLLQIIQDSFV